MPLYVRICTKRHTHEVYRAFSDCLKPAPCPKCLQPTEIVPQVPNISGGMISEKTRELLRVPLGRKNMERVRTVGDVDKVVGKIEKKWSHMATGLGRNTAGYTKVNED